MPKEMTHNDYDIYKDLVKPISEFFTETGVVTTTSYSYQVKQVHWSMTLPPEYVVQ